MSDKTLKRAIAAAFIVPATFTSVAFGEISGDIGGISAYESRTIEIPGFVPAAEVDFDDDPHNANPFRIEGIKNLRIKISMTSKVIDLASAGPTGRYCETLDQRLAIDLKAGEKVEIVLTYDRVSPTTGAAQKEELHAGVTATQSAYQPVNLCVR
jgi:hypothetical protein